MIQFLMCSTHNGGSLSDSKASLDPSSSHSSSSSSSSLQMCFLFPHLIQMLFGYSVNWVQSMIIALILSVQSLERVTTSRDYKNMHTYLSLKVNIVYCFNEKPIDILTHDIWDALRGTSVTSRTQYQEDAIFNMNMIWWYTSALYIFQFRIPSKCKLIIISCKDIPRVSTLCWVWLVLHKLWHHARGDFIIASAWTSRVHTHTHSIYHILYNYINIWERLYADVTVRMCLSCFFFHMPKVTGRRGIHMRETLEI